MSAGDLPADEVLAKQAQAGDMAALDVLLARHAERIANRLGLMMSTNARADMSVSDVLQNVFEGACRNIGDFRDTGPGSFWPWLWGIVNNKRVDALRKHYRRKKVIAPGVELPASLIELAHRTTPSAAAMATELKALLAQKIDGLTPDQQEALTLVYGQQHSHAEAGAILGISAAAVEKRVKRAREILREFIERHGFGSA